ncbi:ricin-type beta-trefoil lectin domain protein [Ceratobasidium sp. AG-Ba]|nr:ricin-type beta-trefoil lectin domain protein [Ceratobasidium sp. AG-Ba]
MPRQELSPGLYVFKNVMTDTCMDASSKTGLVGSSWTIQHNATGKFIKSPNLAPGAITEVVDNGAEYKFIVYGSAYKISPTEAPNLAMDLNRGNLENRAAIVLWHDSQFDNQRWILERVGS